MAVRQEGVTVSLESRTVLHHLFWEENCHKCLPWTTRLILTKISWYLPQTNEGLNWSEAVPHFTLRTGTHACLMGHKGPILVTKKQDGDPAHIQ